MSDSDIRDSLVRFAARHGLSQRWLQQTWHTPVAEAIRQLVPWFPSAAEEIQREALLIAHNKCLRAKLAKTWHGRLILKHLWRD
jgi:hypothetical protein